MKRISTAALFAFATSLAVVPNAAQAKEEVLFSYAASELQSFEGRNSLLERMKAKAQSACRADSAGSTFRTVQKRCVRELEAQWLEAIDSPALVAQTQTQGPQFADARP